jgi:hypothetical protein
VSLRVKNKLIVGKKVQEGKVIECESAIPPTRECIKIKNKKYGKSISCGDEI